MCNVHVQNKFNTREKGVIIAHIYIHVQHTVHM